MMKKRIVATLGLLVLSASAGDLKTVPVQDADKLSALCADWKAVPAVKPRKVLWFSECYGYNHQDGRNYGERAFKCAGEKSGAWEFVQVKDPSRLVDAEFLSGFDAICFCNSTGLSEAKTPGLTKALTAFVKGGKGVVLIHAGLDAFKDSDALLDLFGGYFRGHPWGGGGTWRFLNEQPGNPLNASFRDEPASFSRSDEIYQFPAFFSREKCNVLISMDLADPSTKAAETAWTRRCGAGSMRHDHDYAVSWTREVGKGRVFYTSFGHDKRAFLDRARLYHMFAGLQYALGDLSFRHEPEIRPDVPAQRLDWANGPWREKLDAVVKSAQGQTLDLVLFGDSITHGWIYSENDRWSGGKEVWARHFGKLKTAILGMAGDRTEHLLWRVGEGGQADGWKAKTILVMIGINNAIQTRSGCKGPDAPNAAAKGMKAVVDTLVSKHPESRVVIVACLPCAGKNRDWARRYNAIVKGLADGQRVFFQDIGGAFMRADGSLDASLFSDGLHPNPAGYERAAVEIEKLMESGCARSTWTEPQISKPGASEQPRYAWRGLRFEEGGTPFGKEVILDLVRRMADCKLNVFRWTPGVRDGKLGYTEADFAAVAACAKDCHVGLIVELPDGFENIRKLLPDPPKASGKVVSPDLFCRLDVSQELGKRDSFVYNEGVANPVKRCYWFDPSAGSSEKVVGAEAVFRAGAVRDRAQLEWTLWPRLCAFAEALWTGPEKRNWCAFAKRLEAERERLIMEHVNCAPFDPLPEPEPEALPPLLTTTDGKAVKSAADWEQLRRPEIRRRFLERMYGLRPAAAAKPDVSFAAAEPDKVMMDGAAIRKRIRCTYRGPFGTNAFVFTAFIPRGTKPAPSFVFICNRSAEKNLDPERNVKSGFWPAEEIVARGYAAIAFFNGDVAPDTYNWHTAYLGGVFPCYERFAERNNFSWGSLSAWAWGASRVMDWIEREPLLDAKRVGVVGHSRGGKASLLAGATDERFAMTCVNCSGCGGAKLGSVDLPESEHYFDFCQGPVGYWFCPLFRVYFPCHDHPPSASPYIRAGGRAYGTLEDDQHEMLALVAPRLLVISSASQDPGAGPYGEFLSTRLASSVWELYGLKGISGASYPPSMVPLGTEAEVSYHQRSGEHDLTPYNWQRFMDFADNHGWSK